MEAGDQILRSLEGTGLALEEGPDGLVLTDGEMAVRADFTHMVPRLRQGALQRELLVRAAKLRDVPAPRALDATAGLGDDSLMLAAAGFEVLMCERNPVIAALLADGLRRASALPELADAVGRMRLAQCDSVQLMGAAEGHAFQVVLLDPMFPERRKSSAVKKKLQLLQRLERPCEDEVALLEAALRAASKKVVVKRPAKGPHLAGRKPSYSTAGKAVRYDCYLPK